MADDPRPDAHADAGELAHLERAIVGVLGRYLGRVVVAVAGAGLGVAGTIAVQPATPASLGGPTSEAPRAPGVVVTSPPGLDEAEVAEVCATAARVAAEVVVDEARASCEAARPAKLRR